MDNGFSSPSTDEPLAGNPRVHEEGRHNYERNNRSSDWFAHKSEVIDTRPEARLRSDAARANALKNHGTVQDDLRGYGDDTHTVNGRSEDEKVKATVGVPAVKEDVITNGVASVVESYANLEVSAKQSSQANTPNIEEHKVIEKVSPDVAVNHVNSAPTAEPEQSPPLIQRPSTLGSGGKGANVGKQKKEQETSKGTKTSKDSKHSRLHQESTGSALDQTPPHHRLRADGEGIARKNNTDSINEIISPTNNYPKVIEPKVDKNTSEFNTPRKPPTPRIRPDGLHNLQKSMNHSEMSAIMHQSPVEAAPPRPSSGRKILPHLQRSELW